MGAEEIFQSVFDAMQPAEELGGPSGDEYLQLMERIIQEAQQRADTYRQILLESPAVA